MPRIVIDTDAATLRLEDAGGERELPLYSTEAFEIVSSQWVKVGWNQRYPYTFSWLGRPLIQLPEDLVRIQEVIWRVRPDVILETGIAHGGSLIFYASLCTAIGHGRVIGIDVEIRPANRSAIEAHGLSPLITLLEGDSAAESTVAEARRLVDDAKSVLVILDSDHSKAHVLRELEAYHSLVSPGSYIVATDGIMGGLHRRPHRDAGLARRQSRGRRDRRLHHPEFVLEQPPWPLQRELAHAQHHTWPGAYLRRAT